MTMKREFEIGDKVTVIGDVQCWTDDYNLGRDVILEVVDDGVHGEWVNPDAFTIRLEAVRRWSEDFELFNEATPLFLGKEAESHIKGFGLSQDDQTAQVCVGVEDGLGVYRPVLETRKLGKVALHMVDDGFPNALKAVAEVMTWAAVNKGYKLHDWKNLPNADVEFPSAEGRHRTENSIMKAKGVEAIKRTDHESNLLHNAHKAFNALAELELVLTGVIK